MADHVVPHFHNDLGVPVIDIGAHRFMCVGANPPFDHPHVFLDMGGDKDIREWALTMCFVARALERTGDNAVDVGEQVAFVVTGLFREFEDASHPELAPP